MTDKKFKTSLEILLKKDSRLLDEYKELNLGKLRELVDKTDEQLIQLLLSNEETRKKFFFKVKDVYVFKQNDLKFFLDANQIDNSYTAYENRIGLTYNSRLLKDTGDVVLNFPYKDCVLEGGQSTEEGIDEYYAYDEDENKYELHNAQRKEIFFNEVLAQDEIDRLLEPKAFTKIKKYTVKGEEKLKDFTRNKNGRITDNLIIKGNNLLALHSLKEQFSAQVKLIYIDPPYNTGSDEFKYNDNFNHSTWLTFIKNRLDIALELLKDEGVIFIQIDYRELAYLKVLADYIFGRDNFLGQINWQRVPEGRTLLGQGQSDIKIQTEYILVYAKRKRPGLLNNSVKKKLDATEKIMEQYALILKEKSEPKLYKTFKDGKEGDVNIYIVKDYELKPAKTTDIKEYLKSYNNYVQSVGIQTESSFQQKIISVTKSLSGLCKVEFIPTKGKRKGAIVRDYFIGDRKLLFVKDYSLIENNRLYRESDINDFWSNLEIQVTDIAEEGGIKLKRGKKPEDLLYRILKWGTHSPDDIVLDFFMGSGTTAAVAHKIGLQYIGIEQLDYGENDSVSRLKNVINGDASGSSKQTNWKGGASFIYLELKKWNEEAKEKITKCKSLKELESLLSELSDKYFLHYNVKFEEFKEKIIKETAFKKLPLRKQQEMIAKMLDLNQLYVNAAEMEDKKYGLGKEDIALTKKFYNV